MGQLSPRSLTLTPSLAMSSSFLPKGGPTRVENPRPTKPRSSTSQQQRSPQTLTSTALVGTSTPSSGCSSHPFSRDVGSSQIPCFG